MDNNQNDCVYYITISISSFCKGKRNYQIHTSLLTPYYFENEVDAWNYLDAEISHMQFKKLTIGMYRTVDIKLNDENSTSYTYCINPLKRFVK